MHWSLNNGFKVREKKTFNTGTSDVFVYFIGILLDTFNVELKIWPDIRSPAYTGYPVSAFKIGRIFGKISNRCIPTGWN
jgi:hypothetical protein